MSSSTTMFSHHYSRVRIPGGPVGFGFKDDFALCSRRSGRPDGSTMKSSSASRKQRPRRARATKRTRISAAIARDLAEGDEGIDVELLQKDLTEEGLLDRKHANGYVGGGPPFLDIVSSRFQRTFFLRSLVTLFHSAFCVP